VHGQNEKTPFKLPSVRLTHWKIKLYENYFKNFRCTKIHTSNATIIMRYNSGTTFDCRNTFF
jgi:hypothetical protein